LAWLAALLVGYWALMALVPVPGHGAGVYDRGANLANYVDQQYLPGKAWEEDGWDPEGLLSTIPAVGSCLIGVLCGQILVSSRSGPRQQVLSRRLYRISINGAVDFVVRASPAARAAASSTRSVWQLRWAMPFIG
jgi:predicted acyltransferase